MTYEEVEGYIAKVEKGLKMPEPDRSEYIARLKAWGDADDGEPAYLANIMQFNDPIQPWPGIDIPPASAEATNKVYLAAVTPLALREGVWPVIASRPQGMGSAKKSNLAGFYSGFDAWNEININRCRSRRAVMEVLSNPEYLKVMPYKFAAFKVMVVPASAKMLLPDLRLAIGAVLVIVFLLVGWIRSARYNRK